MNIKTLFAVGLMAVCGMVAVITVVADQPHLQRVGTNLLTNPDFNGNANGWTLTGSVYDSTVSRDVGTGSLKFTNLSDRISTSEYIAVTPGNTYTLAFYMRSSTFPPPIPILYGAYYDSNHVSTRNITGTSQGVTASNSWQECAIIVRPQVGEVYFRIKMILSYFSSGYTGSFWADNFYFGQNIGFEQAPTAKVPFNGTQTKIDELGNVQIYKNGGWQPFFPIIIYGDGDRPNNYSLYSAQGFNVEARAGDATCIQNAKNATSTFNPDGMMAGFDITTYILSESTNYNNLTLLNTRLDGVKNNNLMDSVLWYYWDNECWDEWDVALNVTDAVRAKDLDANSNLMHPIYALQGNDGSARKYSNSQVTMTDIVGDYVTLDKVSQYPDETRGALGLIVLGNIERQQNPVVVAQINHGTGNRFRPRVFNAIAKGAKGIGCYKDNYGVTEENPDSIDITLESWWDDMPNIRTEIDLLMPVIQMPHWTSWSLSSNNSLIDFGTRDYRGQGHVIVTNEQSTAQSVTFTISGLTSYTPTVVKNFFTHEIETKIINSQFTVSIPAYGSKVYVLEDVLEETLQLYLAFSETAGSATVADWSFFTNDGTVMNGAALGSGLLTLDGTNDYINCGRDASLDMGTSDMTIAARIKLSTTPNTYSSIVAKGGDAATHPGYAFAYYQTLGELILSVSNGTIQQTLNSNTSLNLSDDTWHTVGVSYDRGTANTATFYVDGNAVGSEASLVSGSLSNTSWDASIGFWVNPHYFKGQINNVNIYRKALNSQEMADLSNCVLDQDFNHTNATDASLYGNDGTLMNGATVSNGALTLDGTNDYVNLGRPASLEINTQSITVVARVKLNASQPTCSSIFTKGAASAAQAGYSFYYYKTSGFLALAVGNGTSNQTLNSSTNLNLHDDVWHTVGVSYDRGTANTATFYVDGNAVGSEVSTITGNFTNTSVDSLIGWWVNPHWFNGQIDRVKVYKRALSSSEMQYITKQWNR